VASLEVLRTVQARSGVEEREERVSAYYNEIEPYAAEWLKNLADQGHIAPGPVDARLPGRPSSSVDLQRRRQDASESVRGMSESWVIVWGWAASGSTLWRESFTDKRRCWGRVRALMNVLDQAEAEGSEKRVPTLQVWKGTEVTTFRRYSLGSRFARWGRWGSFTMGSADAG
jgi:hypothetical protein